MLNPTRAPRPRLTLRILGYACADIFGLTTLAIGATWFIDKKPTVLASFPTNMLEAGICAIGGLVVMFWGVVHVLQELAKQAPEMQAKYERYAAEKRGYMPKKQDD